MNPSESWRGGGGGGGGEGERAGIRRQRLDEDARRAFASPDASRKLRDERERALLGPEVGEAERLIRVEDNAESHLGEVVALGHHLGPEQHAAWRRLELHERPGQAALARGDVGVQAEHRELRAERLAQLVLDALGARAVAGEADRAAFRTAIGNAPAMAAV